MSSRTSDPAFGPYQLLGLLGRGAMGEVYRAHHTGHRRDVAVKLLRADLAGEPEYRARFGREAELAGRLTDPHVIPIHAFGEIDGRLYLEMRLVEGTDLDELLQSGPLPAAAAADIVTQVASALDAAHAAGLVHRDVKPSNVLLTAPGTDQRRFAYLCDFGIALPIDTTDPRLTQTSHLVGTCAYMAPERFSHQQPDRLADVYSLACLLYTALTGQVPFPNLELFALIAAHGSPGRPRPSALCSTLPAAMDDVVRRGMAVQKEVRYASAGALAAAAQAALADPGRAPVTSERTTTNSLIDTSTVTRHRAATETPTGRRASRLGDPWAWLIAAGAGGTTWAVLPSSAPAIPLAAGVAAVVLGTAVAGNALLGRPKDPPPL